MPDESVPTQVAELWDLVRAYAKQETIEPLKGIGRYVAFGLAGSFLLGTGVIFLALAGLRALETETGDAFDGNWSFAPYVIVLLGCAAVVGLAISRTGKKERS
ncbi:MAG: hypothetical protein JF603_10600 [Acidobacteria bacterium]|nr:hypothetical protein [Acidobacteriota bacterium]